MNCTVEQSVLNQTLNEAQRFVASKALNPVLSGIYLESIDQGLVIRATTGQATYQTKLTCQTEQVGKVVVPAAMLVSVIKSLDKEPVQLVMENDLLRVRQGTVNFEIAVLSVEDFPSLPEYEASTKFLLPVQEFSDAVEKVLVASSRDESKPVLTSLLLEMSTPNALVASDGFRLFRMNVDLSLDLPQKLLLPAKQLRELLGLLKKTEGTVLPCFWNQEKGQVVFEVNSTVIQLSQIAGDFPNYRAIIPEASSFSVTVDRELLKQRIQQIMVVAKELSNIVVFSQEGNEMVVSSQASVRGSSAGKLAILANDGEMPKFACNGTYVLDFLSAVDTQEIVIQGTESLKPVVFGIPGDSRILYLIMPFKLQS